MINLMNRALDFIFPPVCGICGEFADNNLCDKCKDRINLISKFKINTDEDKEYIAHFWLFKYEDIRELMLRYKFNECSYLSDTFSEIILNNQDIGKILRKANYIIPVPIHKKRLYERGYNQCELIAKKLSRKIDNLEYLPNLLCKKKNIIPQSTLDKEERKNNINGAFCIKYRNINFKGKTVILFDDIFTTGSTIKECVKTMKSLKFKRIYVFTIAKN